MHNIKLKNIKNSLFRDNLAYSMYLFHAIYPDIFYSGIANISYSDMAISSNMFHVLGVRDQ